MSLPLSSLSTLEKVEKISQAFYTSSLLFMPAWWLSDNFLDQSAAEDREIALCNVLGVLCGCLFAVTTWARTIKGAATEEKRNLDYVAAGCWGTCGLLTLSQAAQYKADKLMVNLGLQLGIGAAFVYQGLNRKDGGEKEE
ncbi:hypothetical protein TrRE_jg2993 [Triparma retinervis]|jgi:hypothetical protein|uniref:Uncharacterized protein n=1 Tax=Triparma retinervis TaxID=2557542 RepID=A0A9W6ZMP0_9STRA|nr:hypothetical protein TrRE_jg2993 [Triparma retinervis]